MKTTNKAFTIIELLVVIAIIGLISSVVLVSMKGSTGKAKIAKGLEFSQTILNTTGVDAVGMWSFDEGSGSTAFDKSGYGNHGTINGATWVDGEDNTPHWYANESTDRSALKFDGINDYVGVVDDNSLDITDAITIEAWIYPRTIDSLTTIVAKQNSTSTGGQAYGMHITGDKLQYRASHQSVSSDSNIKTSIWSHVVVAIDGSHVKLYINGVLDKTASQVGIPIITDKPVQIGYRGEEGGGGGAFDGLIDEVRIYARALGSSEIQQHYADGAPRHQLVINNK